MKFFASLFAIALLPALPAGVSAQEKRTHIDPGKMEPYWVTVVPKEGAPASARPIPGARHSVFIPVFRNQNSTTVTPYSEEQFEKLRIGWPGFLEKAQKAAEIWLREAIPTFRLDEETGEPIYGVIHAEHPLTAGLILAPSFPRLFAEALGSESLVAVVPDQYSIYVFPAKKSAAAAFGDLIAASYGAALEKGIAGSPELFFLGDDERGLHVVGGFDGRTETRVEPAVIPGVDPVSPKVPESETGS